MCSRALILSWSSILCDIITILWHDCVISLIQEYIFFPLMVAPSKDSSWIDLKTELLESIHEKHILVLSGNKFLLIILKCFESKCWLVNRAFLPLKVINYKLRILYLSIIEFLIYYWVESSIQIFSTHFILLIILWIREFNPKRIIIIHQTSLHKHVWNRFTVGVICHTEIFLTIISYGWESRVQSEIVDPRAIVMPLS